MDITMESQVICLDTSVLIEYYRKKDKRNSFFYVLAGQYDKFAVSAITEFEIYIGSNSEQDKFWNEFFNHVISLPFNSEANRVAVKIYRSLKRKNLKIESPDLFIAACALTGNMKLATLNARHFSRIEDLVLITNTD